MRIPAFVGVDPGTKSLGVAVVSGVDGALIRSWPCVPPSARKTARQRMPVLWQELRGVLDWIASRQYDDREALDVQWVVVEEAIFPGMGTTSIALLAEVRGMVIAETWGHAWQAGVIRPDRWKRFLSANERRMKKDDAYVRYFNRTRKWKCRTPDEVDAVLIAQAAVYRSQEEDFNEGRFQD